MFDFIKKIEEKWITENVKITSIKATDTDILLFEKNEGVILPPDAVEYYKKLNGTDGYDDDFFEFYALNDTQDIATYAGNIIDANILKKDIELHNLYVFGEYMISLYIYAIRLDSSNSNDGIFVFCGNEYKKIATSFTDFFELYLEGSQDLFL